MHFGANLQYLRKLHGGMSQEKLAERMNVSRQTVSRWESNDTYPEIPKLLELCDLFSCKLDELLRENMNARCGTFSPVTIEHVKGFRMASYVMITPNPEDDVNAYMDAWVVRSGLASLPGETPKRIGWDFPFLSPEQKNRFGLRGYAAAYVLPEGFDPACGGPAICCQPDADYAVITVRNPFSAPFELIPHAYQLVMDYLRENGYKDHLRDGESKNHPASECLPCFEWCYRENDEDCMRIYVLALS